MVTKRIVCLANSRKNNGRCVAGREVAVDGIGEWIRPVSARETQEISESERRYHDGGEPQLGDIIEISLELAKPDGYQSENWLINAGRRWRRVGAAPRSQLTRLVEDPRQLWPNGYSTRHGINDRVPLSALRSVSNSLLLIQPRQVTISAVESRYGGIRVRARFRHRGGDYDLAVTHPLDERRPLRLPYEATLTNCLLTISLGEPFRDYAYKLVAAVMPQTDKGE